MAVFQDLPPELLHRILELAVHHTSGYWRKLILQRTSVVASAWRQASQELLLQDVTLSAVYPARTLGYTSRLRDCPLAELERLTIDRFTAADVELATRHMPRLRSLVIVGDHAPFPASSLSPRLLQGTRSSSWHLWP